VFEQAIQKDPPAFSYRMPNFQNSTRISMSRELREKLLAICERYKIPLVEDAFEEDMQY
jgi:GntR family transcriptional regulator/MocR family aminotransferase